MGDALDVVLALAAGRRHHRGIALGLADERLGQRRHDGDLVRLQIRFVFADDLIAHFGVLGVVEQRHGRPEHHLAGGGNLGHVDHLRVRQLALDVANAGFGEALALLRGVVFGVLAQVAVLAGRANSLGDGRADDVLQLRQLFAQLLGAGHGHWRHVVVLGWASPACRVCRRRTLSALPWRIAVQIASPPAKVVV